MHPIAIFYCHQGWSDIFNWLPLLDYYLSLGRWERIYVFIREDAKGILEFYSRSKPIVLKYLKAHMPLALLDRSNVVSYAKNIMRLTNFDILVHGVFDMLRNDAYQNKYLIQNNEHFFIKSFYTTYDIPYSVRVEYFTIERDIPRENEIYENFVKKHGSNYILTHEIASILSNGEYTIVNINGASQIFFDYIKILECAKEIHLLDSVWGCFVYLLDAKYGLFSGKTIHIYCKRGYAQMFNEPVKLENWILHTE
jgi:hypothetical protein